MATSAQLLTEIQKKTQEQLQNNEAAFVASQSGANAAAAISEASAATLRATAEAQATIVRETMLAQQKVEQAKRTAALAAGYDPSTGAGPLLDKITAINQKGAEVTDLTKKLRQERSVKIWENPMAWVQANFLSDTEEQTVFAANELEAEATVLNALNTAVQTTARTAEATAQTITAAKIEASEKVAATDANLRAYQAKQEGIKYRTAAATAPAELTAAQLGALNTLRNAQMAEQNYNLNLAQEARAREVFDWQKERARIEDDREKTKESFDGYVIETINIANKRLNRPEITGMDAKAMLQLLKGGGSEELNALYKIGMSFRLNPKSGGIIGTDAANAWENVVKLQAVMTEKEQEVINILGEVRKTLPATSIDPKTGKILDTKKFQDNVNGIVSAQFSSIRPGSGNLFDVGELAPYVSIDRELQATPFGQQVLLPIIASKSPTHDPAYVIDRAIEAVSANKITLTQAASGLAQTYQRASAIHQGQLGLTSFGIVPPGGGLAQYNARLGFMNNVNLANPVDISRYISRKLGEKSNPFATSRSLSVGSGGFPGTIKLEQGKE